MCEIYMLLVRSNSRPKIDLYVLTVEIDFKTIVWPFIAFNAGDFIFKGFYAVVCERTLLIKYMGNFLKLC